MQSLAAIALMCSMYSVPNNALYIGPSNAEYKAAVTDRAQFPITDHKYYYYFTTAKEVPEYQVLLADVLAYTCVSLSYLPDASFQVPTQVTPTLFRIDTRGLGWQHTFASVIRDTYPYYDEFYSPYYRKTFPPLVIDAKWFVANILDALETKDAQYRLLYGTNKYPKTEKEFFDFWQISKDVTYSFGMVAGSSPVAIEGERTLENHAAGKRGYCWITGDSEELVGIKDPIENLHLLKFRKLPVDAREYIVGVMKWRNGKRGCVQAYWLANGQGQKQDFAPIRIVRDYTRIRGDEIVNSSSCFYCHVSGLLPPSIDSYKQYLEKGNHIDADYKTKYDIESFLQSDIGGELQANNVLFADGVMLVNGMKPEQNGAAFKLFVTSYDANLSLVDAARELYCEPQELQNAIAYYSRTTGKTGARASALGTGGQISRDDFKFRYYFFQEVLRLWRNT